MRRGSKKPVQLVLLVLVSMCFTLSVYSNDITYNQFNVGLFLSDRDSDYLSKDLNFYGDINFSKNLYEFQLDYNQLGFHFWADVTQSRDLSSDSAYELKLLQSASGFGVHYSTEFFSTYLRIGKAGSSARFKPKSRGLSVPPVSLGGGSDIFMPPISIFNSERPNSTYENKEDGMVGKIGFRFRMTEKYEAGAAVAQSNMDSFGTEFSAYLQRDFHSSSINVQSAGRATQGGFTSIKIDAAMADNARSLGLSLSYSY